MAEATIRCNLEGAWAPLTPTYSLGIDADQHGPRGATFVTTQPLPRDTDIQIEIGGLLVAEGWVESCEGIEDGPNLYTITVACEQQGLDDVLYTRNYIRSGFSDALDGRDAPGIDMVYWARSGLVLDDRTITMGLVPGTIFYASQAIGVTIDLGEGDAGPFIAWIHQSAMNLPPKLANYMVIRCHSARNNHHPPVAGQYQEFFYEVGGTGVAEWRGFAFTANVFRYVTLLFTSNNTYDLDPDAPEWWISFDDVRISTLPTGGGTVTSQNGSTLTADQVMAHIVGQCPRLTLGTNPTSVIDMHGFGTNGYATPRQMLERLNLDHWRYRVNPGRRLDRDPYPTIPTFTVSRDARARLRTPDTFSTVVVAFTDLQGDTYSIVQENPHVRRRYHQITLEGSSTIAQAQAIAAAFLADQAQRTVEGTVTVAPGQIVQRPSGAAVHPSEMLLAGGDRVWVEEAGDSARIVGVSYSHDSETVTLELSDVSDNLSRALGLPEGGT
jgi:hypothetical protein